MKYIIFFSILTLTGVLSSCVEHEVIPPPKPVVDLSSSFRADTGEVTIVYTKDVDGFFIDATNFRELQTSPQLSSIKYINTISSTSNVQYVRFRIGKAFWDDASGNFPSLSQFQLFFDNSTNPLFSVGGEQGVEIEWRDANNKIWKTTPDTEEPQAFQFTSLVQESDESGDYMKFNAVFSCTLYSADGQDSVRFDNGSYSSYFRNN
jgi:hypothetical protein